MAGHVLQPRHLSRCLPPGPAFATPLSPTRPPLPRGRGPSSDTRRQIFKWRSLILTIPRPFVTRRLNKDEMEFLCLVTNQARVGVISMRVSSVTGWANVSLNQQHFHVWVNDSEAAKLLAVGLIQMRNILSKLSLVCVMWIQTNHSGTANLLDNQALLVIVQPPLYYCQKPHLKSYSIKTQFSSLNIYLRISCPIKA